MKRVVTAVLALCAAGCLNTVEDHWCDSQTPCTQGFVCTSTFHCIAAPRGDGGTGGGHDGGSGGGSGGGGAFGGGSGGSSGGGGGSSGGGGGASGGGGGAFGGGGGAFGGGAGGGGFFVDAGGGPGGGPGGGGGSTICSFASCQSGCCFGDRCVPFNSQGNPVCGAFGQVCMACGPNEGCVAGKCQPVFVIDGGTTGVIGAACTTDQSCGSDGLGFCIPAFDPSGQSTGFVGGYCSRMCDNTPCPPGGSCIPAQTSTGGTVNVCFASCMTQVSCRMGYRCDTQNGGICVP